MNRIKEVNEILKNRIKASSFDSRDTQIWGIDEAAEQIDKLYNEPDQDEIERDKISKSNAIGLGLIEPDQSSRLLDDGELCHASGCVTWRKGMCVYSSRRLCPTYVSIKSSAKAQLAKDEAEIKELQTKLDEWQLGFEHFLTTNHKLVKKIIATHIEAFISSMRRFWAKVEVCPNGCWEWRGATNGKGYGQFWNGERAIPAHRFLYELFIKKIDGDLEIDHLCRNQKCVNPSHLEAVTHRENLRRGMGRQHWLRKTHCKHGHPFNEENTYTRPGTIWRDCRICHKRWSRETRLRKSLERIEARKANPTSEVEDGV